MADYAPIDADGHVMETDDELRRYLPPPFEGRRALTALPVAGRLAAQHEKSAGPHAVLAEVAHVLGRLRSRRLGALPDHGFGHGAHQRR